MARAVGWQSILGAAVLSFSLGSSIVRAQTAPASPAASSSALPVPPPPPSGPSAAPAVSADDIVLLKNGGMVRGMIVEMVPDGSVSIRLPGGESRTYPMAEVEYAGPSSRMPARSGAVPPKTNETPAAGRTSGPYTVIGDTAKITLTSSQSDLTYYIEGGTAVGGSVVVQGFTRLCTAPCEVELPVGEYTFALSSGGAAPTRVKQGVRVEDGTALDATHKSNKGARKAGWTTFGLGLGLGTTLMVISLATPPEHECSTPTAYNSSGFCSSNTDKRTGYFVAGAIADLIALAIGLPMALTRDSVTIKPVVGAPAAVGAAPSTAWLPSLAGMGLAGRF